LVVIEVFAEGLIFREIGPGWTVDKVQQLIEPTLQIALDLKGIELQAYQ
jgi:acyl CoA:acetate/3-ketoacid CoA transferase beta subunit